MIKLNQPPKGGFLQWVVQQPEQVAAYLQMVYALQNFEAVTGNNKRYPIKVSDTNVVLDMKSINDFTLPNPIADSITSTLSVSTQLNLLLAALRSVKQLPS